MQIKFLKEEAIWETRGSCWAKKNLALDNLKSLETSLKYLMNLNGTQLPENIE